MATHSADPGTHTEVLPMFTEVSPGFDTVMRGYDRGQVDSYLLRVDADVRAANNERQNAMARSADLAAQLASTQAQVESLRRQLRTATEQITTENVDEKVATIVRTAQADATALRGSVQEEAEAIRNGAADAAARTKAAAHIEAERITEEATTRLAQADAVFRQKMAEIDAHRTQVDPEGFWMRIPDSVMKEIFPWEEFLLARSLVETGFGEGDVEDDLFAGVRRPERVED